MKFNFKDKRKVFLVIVAVICMGCSLSFLVRTDLGEDPYSYMNLQISARIGWTLGNWQALINIVLLLVVFLIGRKNIGIGTIANMFLVGYVYDLFTWLENFFMPEDLTSNLFMRIGVAAPALVVFILAAALYMTCDLGSSPYDALSFILYEKTGHLFGGKLPFRIVRIAYDAIACLIGFAIGTLPGILTILITLFLGPVTQWMSGILKKYGVIAESI